MGQLELGIIMMTPQTRKRFAAILSLLAAPAIVWANTLVLPFTFSSGTPIRASEMNANFAAVKQAIDDLDSRISIAGSGLFKSGTRLKAATQESTDGAAVPFLYTTAYGAFAALYDSQQNVYCAIYPTVEALKDKCVPVGSSVGYSDSACNSRVLVIDSSYYRQNLAVGPNGATALVSFEAELDGGVHFYTGNRVGVISAQAFYKTSYSTTAADGGIEWVTSCNTNGGQNQLAQITGSLPLSDIASVTVAVH